MPAYLRLDMFPAVATVNSAVIHKPARVFVTEDSIHVYMDGTGAPREVYTARLADYTGDRRSGYTATTDSGDVIKIERSNHCGCGSRLRGFNPFRGVPMTRNN